MKRILFVLILILGASIAVEAACSGNAASPQLWTVSTATDAAIRECVTTAGNASLADGDSVFLDFTATANITAGSLQVDKAITIYGRTCTTTTTGNAIGHASSCPTKLGFAFDTGYQVFYLTLVATKTTRIHDLGFVNVSATYATLLSVQGQANGLTQDGRSYRIDHSTFGPMPNISIGIHDAWGLIDHNSFTAASDGTIVLYFYLPNDTDYPDARWAATTNQGNLSTTANGWNFVESNYATTDGTRAPFTDGYSGAKYVVRANHLNKCMSIENHGSDSSGRVRGTRAMEGYLNSFANCTGVQAATYFIRSGTFYTWGNDWAGYTGATAATLVNYPALGSGAFGSSDGTNPFDINDAGNPQDTDAACPSGVCTVTTQSTASSTTTLQTVAVAGANWTNDELVGYSIHKVGCERVSTYQPCGLLVVDNTATTITYNYSNAGMHLDFLVGDQFTLNLITYTMDQPCRSTGAMGTARIFVPGSSMTRSGSTATVVMSAHGLTNGDYVVIWDDSYGGTNPPADWNSGTAYSVNQYVSYTGSGCFNAEPTCTYQSIRAGTNHTPNEANSQYWARTYLGSWYNGVRGPVTVVNSSTFTFALGGDPGYNASGTFFSVTAKPAAWNNQTNDPCYQWLNTNGATNLVFSNSTYYSSIRESQAYYNYGGTVQTSSSSPFNGTAAAGNGVGVGTIARRPATCTAGVFYWALDEGTWNSSAITYQAGGSPYSQGKGYKCTATNTWTAHYTPYDLPHPLTNPSGAVLTSIDPAFGYRDTTVMDLEIVGVNLEGTDMGASTVVNVSGTGVTPSCSVDSAVLITCDFAITAMATISDRSVTVTTDEGTSNAVIFAVVGAAGPALTSISPTSGFRGAAYSMTLVGTGFDTGNGTVTDNCTETTFSNIVIVNATLATATITISAGVSGASCSVTVVTDAGTSNAEIFTVNALSLAPYGSGRTRRGR